MPEQSRSAVPKFASFRPKSAQSVTEDKITAHEGHSQGDHERPRSKGREKSHRHHHHSRRHRSRSPAKNEDRRPSQKLELKSEASALYVVDTKGDPQLRKYGIDRYAIPRFRRVGGGNVLGLPREFKIDKSRGEDNAVFIIDSRSNLSNKDRKSSLARIERSQDRLLRIRSSGNKLDEISRQLDYLEFPSSVDHTQKTASDDSADDETHYRSIEGKAKASLRPDDALLEYTPDLTSGGSESTRVLTFDEEIKEKSIELSRAVKDRPEDIEAWIALIEHQDTLLGFGQRVKRMTTAEKQSTADIKMSMYETALKKAGHTLQNRERLISGLMMEGAKIWSLQEQSKRWDKISKENLSSLVLWKKYLDFHQTNFASFRFETVRDIFINRIELLKTAIEKGRPYEETNALYEHLLYTVLRATVLMREAGYSEMAVAIWQALLEINFVGPDLADEQATNVKTEAFAEFWDSEVLRLGETGALGWKHFYANSGLSDTPDSQTDEELPPLKTDRRTLLQKWLASEKQNSCSTIPARTLDDVNTDDTFRIVMFSDIEKFLIFLPARSLPHLKSLLLNSFLIFCQLPPISYDDRVTNAWWKDQFLRQDMLDVSELYYDQLLSRSKDHDNMDDGDKPGSGTPPCPRSSFHEPGWNYPTSTDTLLSLHPWFHCLENWSSAHCDTNCVPVLFMRNCLKALVKIDSRPQFGEYYLAFEYFNYPEAIKKTAKNLLKTNPASFRIYNAYAIIEWAKGNDENANNIVSSALGMQASIQEKERKDAIRLWKTWVWVCLHQRRQIDALKVLLSIAGNDPISVSQMDAYSPAIRLKARQHLRTSQEYYLSNQDWDQAVIYGELVALLEYLVPQLGEDTRIGRNIDAAINILNNVSESLSARQLTHSVHREILHQMSSQLLYYHARTGSFRPALLRTEFTRSIEIFPQNTMFLSLLSWIEARRRIDDQVQSALTSTVLTKENDSFNGRVFSVLHALRFSNVHGIRAAFEGAFESPACASNAGLWRLYLRFCLGSKEYKASARDIFYRGVRACPWSKSLFLTAFDELSEVFTFAEMRDAYRVMEEKELRIRVDINERLQEFEG